MGGGGIQLKKCFCVGSFQRYRSRWFGTLYITTTSGPLRLRSAANCRIPPQILSSSRNPRRRKGVSKPTWVSTHVFAGPSSGNRFSKSFTTSESICSREGSERDGRPWKRKLKMSNDKRVLSIPRGNGVSPRPLRSQVEVEDAGVPRRRGAVRTTSRAAELRSVARRLTTPSPRGGSSRLLFFPKSRNRVRFE